MDPFNNQCLMPALDPETSQGFWLGHVGQGVYESRPMRPEHLTDLKRLIKAGDLVPDAKRYMRDVGRSLVVYRRSTADENARSSDEPSMPELREVQQRIIDSMAYNQLLKALERVLEQSSDSVDDPLNPLIDMLSDAIARHELKDPGLSRFIAESESRSVPVDLMRAVRQLVDGVDVDLDRPLDPHDER